MGSPSLSQPVPEPFYVEVERDRDVARVLPVGELDMATVGEVEDRLRELADAGVRRFVVDLSGLSFIDSSGIQMILALDAFARRDGIDLALLQGPPAVQRVFEITGVVDRLPFAPR